MISKSLVYISRGGVTVNQIITSCTPTTDQVLWDTNTGRITFGSALGAGVNIVALFN